MMGCNCVLLDADGVVRVPGAWLCMHVALAITRTDGAVVHGFPWGFIGTDAKCETVLCLEDRDGNALLVPVSEIARVTATGTEHQPDHVRAAVDARLCNPGDLPLGEEAHFRAILSGHECVDVTIVRRRVACEPIERVGRRR